MDSYRCVAVCQATAIIRLIDKSTGMRSVIRSGLSALNTRINPFPPPAINPVGPFKLSIQPGKGSLRAAVTMDGRTIASGTVPHSFSKICSANFLV